MESELQSISRIRKIVIIGASTVGKTNLIKRFYDGTFNLGVNATRGLFDIQKEIRINDIDINLYVYDTPGDERYYSLNSRRCKHFDGAIIVFDVTNRQTFNEVKAKWIKNLLNNTPPNFKKILVGNKIDLEDYRKVLWEEGQELASWHDMDYIETSAIEFKNVETIFFTIAKKILDDPNWIKAKHALLCQHQLQLQLQEIKKRKSECLIY